MREHSASAAPDVVSQKREGSRSKSARVAAAPPTWVGLRRLSKDPDRNRRGWRRRRQPGSVSVGCRSPSAATWVGLRRSAATWVGLRRRRSPSSFGLRRRSPSVSVHRARSASTRPRSDSRGSRHTAADTDRRHRIAARCSHSRAGSSRRRSPATDTSCGTRSWPAARSHQRGARARLTGGARASHGAACAPARSTRRASVHTIRGPIRACSRIRSRGRVCCAARRRAA